MYLLLYFSLFFIHFIADFSHLSTDKMLAAKSNPSTPSALGLIFAHAAIHGLLMSIIVALFFGVHTLEFVFALMIVTISHFIIDLGKATMTDSYDWAKDISSRKFWYLFGFDQFLHASVILLIVEYIRQINDLL